MLKKKNIYQFESVNLKNSIEICTENAFKQELQGNEESALGLEDDEIYLKLNENYFDIEDPNNYSIRTGVTSN